MDELHTAGEICKRPVVVATREMRVSEAARLMREERVGSLVVIDESAAGRVVAGILTDRDIAIAMATCATDMSTLCVGDFMRPDVVTARPDDSLDAVVDYMRRNDVRWIAVTTANKLLVGIVALDDLLEVVADELRGLVQAIKSEKTRATELRG